MKCKLITLCLSLVCICSFGGSLDADDIPEFVAGASNAVNIVGGCSAIENYDDICTGLGVSISALEAQYASEILGYQADKEQLTELLEGGMGKHGKNADKLEKIRLILDYKLKQLVLVERLKELEEKHAKVRSKLQNRRNICRDVSEFTDKLSKASKVEFKKLIFSEEDPGYKFESIITKDKLLIEEICSLLSGKIEYDPLLTRRVFESGRRPSLYGNIDPLPSSMTISITTGDSRGAVELIIDDQDYVYLSHSTVECLAKAYSYDLGERRGLDEQIELILKKRGQSRMALP